MKTRNTLGDAYLAAYEATDLAASITLVLDIASERPQPGVDDEQQTKLHDMFRRMHEIMYKAEEEFTAQLAAQPALASPAAVQHVEPAVRSQRRSPNGKGRDARHAH